MRDKREVLPLAVTRFCALDRDKIAGCVRCEGCHVHGCHSSARCATSLTCAPSCYRRVCGTPPCKQSIMPTPSMSHKWQFSDIPLLGMSVNDYDRLFR